MFARKVDPTVDAQTVRRDQHPSHARMRCTLGRGWLSSLALALLTPDPSPEQVRLWDEWMQRKLKGVADPDQEPLGGPSREQSPLERGSNGAAATSDPLEAGGGGAAPQAGQPGAAAGGGGGVGGGGGMFGGVGGGGGGDGGGATAPRRQRARGRLVRSVVFEDGSRCECVPLCEQAG